jgi:hypothetical protein
MQGRLLGIQQGKKACKHTGGVNRTEQEAEELRTPIGDQDI